MRISDWSSDVCSSDLDIDAFRGETNDLLGRVVLRWDIFDGGINRAKYQEMVRRASESRFRLHETERNAEADTRRAWNARETQTAVFSDRVDQSKSTEEQLLSNRQHISDRTWKRCLSGHRCA